VKLSVSPAGFEPALDFLVSIVVTATLLFLVFLKVCLLYDYINCPVPCII